VHTPGLTNSREQGAVPSRNSLTSERDIRPYDDAWGMGYAVHLEQAYT
jgi:hypothetical protein